MRMANVIRVMETQVVPNIIPFNSSVIIAQNLTQWWCTNPHPCRISHRRKSHFRYCIRTFRIWTRISSGFSWRTSPVLILDWFSLQRCVLVKSFWNLSEESPGEWNPMEIMLNWSTVRISCCSAKRKSSKISTPISLQTCKTNCCCIGTTPKSTHRSCLFRTNTPTKMTKMAESFQVKSPDYWITCYPCRS